MPKMSLKIAIGRTRALGSFAAGIAEIDVNQQPPKVVDGTANIKFDELGAKGPFVVLPHCILAITKVELMSNDDPCKVRPTLDIVNPWKEGEQPDGSDGAIPHLTVKWSRVAEFQVILMGEVA
jgi:hypothetical protein